VSDVFPKVLKLSFEGSECKPLFHGQHTVSALLDANDATLKIGRCRLTLSKPRRKRLEPGA